MEKTFEELIVENPLSELLSEPEKDMIKDIMQQVREATKQEDAEIADKYKCPFVAEAILNTPTDRIKIEE